MGYRVLLLCALGSTAFAATTCPTGSIAQQYSAPGFTCTTGAFTFKTFVFQESKGGLDPSLITLTPIESATGIGFLYSGNFTAAQGQIFTYMFSYFIDPPPPIIRGQQVDLDPTGAVTLQTALCATAFPCGSGNDLGTILATTASPNPLPKTLTPTNMLGIQNTFTLDSTSGPATSQGFDNITLVTPEPAAIGLTASGLLGLLAFAKRRKILLKLRS